MVRCYYSLDVWMLRDKLCLPAKFTYCPQSLYTVNLSLAISDAAEWKN